MKISKRIRLFIDKLGERVKKSSSGEGLHIPNIGLHNFIELSDPETIKDSELDLSKRKFSIRIELEDPRARTPHVQISFDKISFHYLDDSKDTVDCWLEKNSDNLLKSIFIGLQKSSPLEAIIPVSEIYPTLSMLSFKLRRPIGIRNIIFKDLTHKATWAMPPSAPSPVLINNVPLSNFHHKTPFGSMFALYREGMSSINEPYKFLCFYKILEAYTKGKAPFDTKVRSPRVVITEALLGGAYQVEYHQLYLNLSVKRCLEKLSDHRDVIAHPFKDKKSVVNFKFINIDLPNFVAEIGALSNMLERIATKILDDELELQALSDPEIATLLENLNKIL